MAEKPKTRQQKRSANRSVAKRASSNGTSGEASDGLLGLRDIMADSMPVVLGPEVRYPREGKGQVVRVLPVTTDETVMASFDLLAATMGSDDALKESLKSEKREEVIATVDQMREQRIGETVILTRLIQDWTLTNLFTGEDLPKPHLNAAAFASLTVGEKQWLARWVMHSLQHPGLETMDPLAILEKQAEEAEAPEGKD